MNASPRTTTFRRSHLIASVVLALILTVATSGVAEAGNLGQYFADGVYIRTGPHLSDTAVGQGLVRSEHL